MPFVRAGLWRLSVRRQSGRTPCVIAVVSRDPFNSHVRRLSPDKSPTVARRAE
ncbi:hypothetical protein GGD89_001250 [Roseospira visakhapatnamensis]|uniref:Uncharacterized protein n=1 Tax=Roseospira visakhapatnamensis TaxID=390880 RepID=A0A7W6RC01_9PROT|nr:hypothetical protein [Roseospira visakhapatnamensis]